MAKQTINIGTAPNDGTGDTARDAFDICNDNFTELYDGKLALDGSTEMTGDLVFTEAADHSSTPAAGKGYLWVKSDTPSSLIFTDDAGTDYDLTDITSTPEGTAILSTGEVGGTKFLREDGDGTSSWQAIPAPEGTSVLSTGPVTDGYVLTADGAGGAAWEAASGGGAFSADAQTQITPTTAIVLDEATGDEVALDLSYTVNKAAGNDTGLLINQTDTSSPGTSLLADFQVGGDSRFLFTADHFVQDAASGGVFSANGSGFYKSGLRNTSIETTGYFGITGSANINTTSQTDTRLYRDAANTLALRNGAANPQTFNVYNTYTDASNYERGFMKWNSNVLEIGTEAAGTGTGRFLKLNASITYFSTSGTNRFLVENNAFRSANSTGAYLFSGSSSSTQPFISAAVDINTGVGYGGADRLSLIAGGTETLAIVGSSGNAIELPTGQTVAGLPTTPAVGMIARVTDASSPAVGSTVTGGGAAAALCWYNGANWVVMGV